MVHPITFALSFRVPLVRYEEFRPHIKEKTVMAARLSDEQIRVRRKSLSGWQLVGGRVKRIPKEYVLGNFLQALRFVNKVGRLAEAEAHHPDITIRYNRVMLGLFTHDEGGITDADFNLAYKFESLAPRPRTRRRL